MKNRSQKSRSGKYLGKPRSHWETEARCLVIEILLKAGLAHQPRAGSPSSIISRLASEQLLALATGVDPRMAREALERLSSQSQALQEAVAGILGTGPVPAATRARLTKLAGPSEIDDHDHR